jgi:hypothetical protein
MRAGAFGQQHSDMMRRWLAAYCEFRVPLFLLMGFSQRVALQRATYGAAEILLASDIELRRHLDSMRS